jgi:hypothetical protein
MKVQELIGACVDDEHMLRRAADMVDESRGGALRKLARERVQFIDELRSSGRTLHMTFHTRGSIAGEARGMALRAWAFCAGENAGDVLTACKHSQVRTEAMFATSLTQAWPKEMSDLLATQHARIEATHKELVGIQYGT